VETQINPLSKLQELVVIGDILLPTPGMKLELQFLLVGLGIKEVIVAAE
jgi:hypothetical protein